MSDALFKELLAFVEQGVGDFGSLALSLFAHQQQHNPDYAAFCNGAVPEHWSEIPAVPVALFRDLPLTCFPPDRARLVFTTSGTTGPQGHHRLLDATLYDRGARLWAERMLGPLPAGGVSLVNHAPSSSLGHMCQQFSPGLSPCFSLETGVDAGQAWHRLSTAREPIFVPGTAFAFADLLAAAPGRVCPLPEGSIVMVTGGFKGHRRTLSQDELYAALRHALPGARLVGEYGMTELSSQLWSVPLGGAFVAPPWMRVMAVDPWSGAPATEGVLRFVDLANHQTVLAIETRDVGRVYPGNRVELLGRLPGAPARGCSLTVEEANQPPATPQRRAVPRFDRDVVGSGGVQPADQARIAAVIRALKTLQIPAHEGLHPTIAQWGLDAARDGITAQGLRQELSVQGTRPDRVSIVCAEGVFAAPMEWAAVYAAAGCTVLLKAPRRTPGFVYALADALAGQGLPVSATTARDLNRPDVVVTFGADDTLSEVKAAWPGARHVGFGHRFSVAWIDDASDVAAVVRDVVMYDSRGCMAPSAIFAPATHVQAIAQQLAEQLSLAPPIGERLPSQGPELRRRVGLARAHGHAVLGEWGGVLTLPSENLCPAALPRMAMLHPVEQPHDLEQVLHPWLHHLSTLAAADVAANPWLAGVRDWFPRWCRPGEMQRPALPRRHDGHRLLGCVLAPA